MSDDTQTVGAGNTGAYEPEETSSEETTTADATATAETTAETGAQDAENATDASTTDTASATETSSTTDAASGTDTASASEGAEVAPDANESRTGFVEKGAPGDECVCPDGRKGTVHKFDNGLICIPNADQG